MYLKGEIGERGFLDLLDIDSPSSKSGNDESLLTRSKPALKVLLLAVVELREFPTTATSSNDTVTNRGDFTPVGSKRLSRRAERLFSGISEKT